MSHTHILGFPSIGAKREAKVAVEAYWQGKSTATELLAVGKQLRLRHWAIQAKAQMSLLPVGDFAWYDAYGLNTAMTFGVIPERFQDNSAEASLDTMFRMARGRAPSGRDVAACEMTKWFDTNYHYIVPEFSMQQDFTVNPAHYLSEIQEATAAGYVAMPVILGPLSFLWLGKAKGAAFNKLDLLDKLIAAYKQLFQAFATAGVEWVQIDEPILVLDLPHHWQVAFELAYYQLQHTGVKTLLTTYFGDLQENANLACELPVDGLHIDCVRAPDQLLSVVDKLPSHKVLSVGVVDGRNIWRTNLRAVINTLMPIKQQLGDRLWISSSCSLLHAPVDLNLESGLDDELKSWLAFAVQKLDEVKLIDAALCNGIQSIARELAICDAAFASRQQSPRIHNPAVALRLKEMTSSMTHRAHAYVERAKVQKAALHLPKFPTTTIGSFPQTTDIRHTRREYKAGRLSEGEYRDIMHQQIKHAIAKQEALGLDVLVHGEAERNDMVEYFGELLNGFAFTENAWVQSYGSRCVKPPIIYGDVSRTSAMTVEWIQFAQQQTSKLMKGMLTGPVTILSWSFVRDDQPRQQTALQIAFALRDEVIDLEKAGIRIIQIDEPAFREGLPLRRQDWAAYLQWAVQAFRVSSCGVQDTTQIHTHMCYSEFNDIIASIADLDADVITLESSRSQMELLEAFKDFQYPNSIGPGVYDIHSPVVPTVEHMVNVLKKAAVYIDTECLWVNPDCGLKTREWPEVEAALRNMVKAALELRASSKLV